MWASVVATVFGQRGPSLKMCFRLCIEFCTETNTNNCSNLTSKESAVPYGIIKLLVWYLETVASCSHPFALNEGKLQRFLWYFGCTHYAWFWKYLPTLLYCNLLSFAKRLVSIENISNNPLNNIYTDEYIFGPREVNALPGWSFRRVGRQTKCSPKTQFSSSWSHSSSFL